MGLGLRNARSVPFLLEFSNEKEQWRTSGEYVLPLLLWVQVHVQLKCQVIVAGKGKGFRDTFANRSL